MLDMILINHSVVRYNCLWSVLLSNRRYSRNSVMPLDNWWIEDIVAFISHVPGFTTIVLSEF